MATGESILLNPLHTRFECLMLMPSGPESYYTTLDLVPVELRADLGMAKIGGSKGESGLHRMDNAGELSF